MKRLFLFIAILAVGSPAFAAERFSKEYICNPELETAEALDCLTAYEAAIEKQREDAEHAALMKAASVEKGFMMIKSKKGEGYAKQVAQSKKSFETYRKHECGRKTFLLMSSEDGPKILAECKIELTERRIKRLNNE